MLKHKRIKVADARVLGCPLLVARIIEMQRMGLKFGSGWADPDTVMGLSNTARVYWLEDPQYCQRLIKEYEKINQSDPVSTDDNREVTGRVLKYDTANGMLFYDMQPVIR
ncbi:MAG: hypothetical protein JEZ07_06375 [Phycisphaerae bacterium]|nr:hypothetical protein [Phycisphaerae bacterium]